MRHGGYLGARAVELLAPPCYRLGQTKPSQTAIAVICLVRSRGLDEPPRPYGYMHLKHPRLGIVLILYSSRDGFAIPHLNSKRIGLSVHTLSALQGVLLLTLGLLWSRLRLGGVSSRTAFWCSIYSALAILAAYT